MGDFALHDLPLLRLADLIADRDAPTGLDQTPDVAVRGVVRDAAHRDEVPLRQRHIEDRRRLLCILKKHLVEIPQPEEQQRVRRQRPPDALVLLHHRRQRIGHFEEGCCLRVDRGWPRSGGKQSLSNVNAARSANQKRPGRSISHQPPAISFISPPSPPRPCRGRGSARPAASRHSRRSSSPRR